MRWMASLAAKLFEPPARVGLGLKAQHYATILAARPEVGFFEIHAQNYRGAGEPPHRFLTAIRKHSPLSLPGVGLSIKADRAPDRDHLAQLRGQVERWVFDPTV